MPLSSFVQERWLPGILFDLSVGAFLWFFRKCGQLYCVLAGICR